MSMTEKLAYIKKLRHLTTEEIAQQSGVPLGTLNKIFSGQTKNPAVGPVDKITQVLRIPIHYLLDDELPIEYCSATSFLRNWDSILEKKRANLRSISEPARLRQPPPQKHGSGTRKRAGSKHTGGATNSRPSRAFCPLVG